MKLETFDPKYVIDYNPSDKESIKIGLIKYKELLDTNKAFKNDYIIAQFKPSVENLDISFFNEEKQILLFLENCCEYYSIFKKDNNNLVEILFTETLFFLCACKFPDLEDEIKSCCQSIVNYSRKINDSSYMWINEENCFGIEPLQIFALVYPQYGYYLASFIIPNWDDEHMSAPLFALAQWIKIEGLNKHTIKAYCYCENVRARQMALSYDTWDGIDENMLIDSEFTLLKHLRENTESYQLFNQYLIEKIREYPLLDGYNSLDEEICLETYIKQLALEVMLTENPVDIWDDDFDADEYLTKIWINNAADIEIEEYVNKINSEIDIIISTNDSESTDYDKTNNTEKDKINHQTDNEILIWKEFFEKCFENGIEIWEYICNGGKSDFLENINEIKIYKETDNADTKLGERLDSKYINSNSEFIDEIKDLTEKFYKELQNKILDNKLYYETLIRFNELIFKLTGGKSATNFYYKLISNKFEYISKEDLLYRLSISWENQFLSNAQNIGSYWNGISRKKLEDCIDFINENREKSYNYFKSNIFNTDDFEARIEESNSLRRIKNLDIYSSLCLGMKLYLSDLSKGIYDNLTKLSLEFVDKFGYKTMLYSLESHLKLDHLDYLNSLLERSDLPEYEQELVNCYYAWKSFADYVETGNFSKIEHLDSTPENFDFLIKYFENDSRFKISENQINHDYFSGSIKSVKRLMIFGLISKDCANLKHKSQINRIFDFVYKLDPILIADLHIKYLSSEVEINSSSEFDLLTAQLLKIKAPIEAYWGIQLKEYIKNNKLEKSNYNGLLLDVVEDYGQENVKNAYKLLSYKNQLKTYINAKNNFYDLDLSKQFNKFFIDKLSRYFVQGYVIQAPSIYLHNKLTNNKIFSKHIKWDTWEKHTDYLDILLNKVDTGIILNESKRESEKKVYNKKGWGYVVLQKVDEKYQVVHGKKLLAEIQNGFLANEIYGAQTHGVIIDEKCPDDLVKLLGKFDTIEFKDYIISLIDKIINNETTDFSELTDLLKFGTEHYIGTTNHNDFEFRLIVKNLDELTQMKVLRILSLISHELLDLVLDSHLLTNLSLLKKSEVETHTILKFLLMNQETKIIEELARREDISIFVNKEKIEDRIYLLSILADNTNYHKFILKQKSAGSKKVKEHVKTLIEKYAIS
jgi:hypothetical protein